MFGPAVPVEIVKGEAEKVFQSYVAQRLSKRAAHQIKRATKTRSIAGIIGSHVRY